MKDFNKIIAYGRKHFEQLADKGLYIILLLFYAYKSSEVPSWAKKVIIGSLAYFVSPIDSIPDLTPVLGMTDDLGVLAFGLVTIACYISDEVREKAQFSLQKILKKELDHEAIAEIDSWL